MSDDQAERVTVPEGTSPADDVNGPGGGTSGTRRILKAIALVGKNLTTGQSKELPPDDILDRLTADGKIIEPPFDQLILATIPEQSTELPQVIEAMTQNIEGFGHRFHCRLNLHAEGMPDSMIQECAVENAMLVNFFSNCCVDYSFTELRKRTRKDLEATGNAYWEVIRNTKGEITQFNHIPSYQIRLGVQDVDFTPMDRKVPILQADGSTILETATYQKRFRPFAQARITSISRGTAIARGWRVRWFKEFGDPRPHNNDTGDVITDPDELAKTPQEKQAGEMIHWRLYNGRSPYGFPRYIGNLITIFGDRAADEVNFVTLKNNNIPSMLLLVSNGQLTDGSIERINEFIEKQIQGSDNRSRFLILEGEGQYEGSETGGMKIDVKPMTEQQMKDQLFQEYGKNNRDKVRECYRLPPIFVGRASDYTRATAESSRRLADEQIFKPERDEFDVMINKLVLAGLGVLYHKFVSNGPHVTDDQDLVNILGVAERAGGMTPRLARQVVADIFGKDESTLPPLDPSIKPDVPFSLQLAEAIKNMGGTVAPIGSQLAVKSSDPAAELVASLFKMQDDLEEALLQRRRSRA